MGFSDDMRAIANQKNAAKRNYTKAEAYAAVIELLIEDIKSSIKYAIDNDYNGRLTGVESFPRRMNEYGDKELNDAAYKAGFFTRDYDGYLVLADMIAETHKKHILTSDSHSYSYTDFGRKLVSDIQKRALKDGIWLEFYLSAAAKGGIHAKERYSLPCSTTGTWSQLSTFFYEWTIV